MKIMYCKNCGNEIADDADVCMKCGCFTNKPKIETEKAKDNLSPKSKMVGGFLGIFLGSLGVHNFYLGRKLQGFIQLAITILALVVLVIGAVNYYTGVMAIDPTLSEEVIIDLMALEFVELYVYSLVFCLMLFISGVWGLIEAIMIFCGKIKDKQGRDLS